MCSRPGSRSSGSRQTGKRELSRAQGTAVFVSVRRVCSLGKPRALKAGGERTALLILSIMLTDESCQGLW